LRRSKARPFILNAGGIAQKNNALNQIYANILGRPVLVPNKSVVSLGSSIFAFLAARTFQTVEEAFVFAPDPAAQKIYDSLYALYRKLYFGFGERQDAKFGDVLPTLIQLSQSAN